MEKTLQEQLEALKDKSKKKRSPGKKQSQQSDNNSSDAQVLAAYQVSQEITNRANVAEDAH